MPNALTIMFHPDSNEFSIGRFGLEMADFWDDQDCWISFPEPPGWRGGFEGMHR